jgi:hypothetical protein
MNLHAKRLQTSLAEIRDRGFFTRLEPPSILIETRRVLERLDIRHSFPVAMLYADWCAHATLDRTGAGTVLLQITTALNRDIRQSSNASIDAVYNGVCSALALKTLQSQLAAVYERFEVDTWSLWDPRMFRQFMGGILDTIAEQPLAYPQDIGKKGGNLRRVYDEACQIACNDPQWIVTECSVTNDLSEQQLAFYGVPKGTYLWQIRTGANVFFCGILQSL